MAEIWIHFIKKGEGKAQCKNCPKILNCGGSSTSGLIRHAASFHNINISKRTLEVQNSSKPGIENKHPSIFKFTKRQSLAEIVSRLPATDGFTIRRITRSEFIR